MIERQIPRESGARPITESKVGAKLVHLMAEGLLGVCDQFEIPYPRSEAEFERTLVSLSRETGFQAGLSFLHKPSHREFYELLGMNPDLAGVPHALLALLAQESPSIERGLDLAFAFATPVQGEDRKATFEHSAKIFRELGGPEFELIAQAFQAGDCQRDLVFKEMQVIIERRKTPSA